MNNWKEQFLKEEKKLIGVSIEDISLNAEGQAVAHTFVNTDALISYIETEIIEKLLKEIPNRRSDLGQGYGSIKNDLSILKQQLRAKWLGNQN